MSCKAVLDGIVDAGLLPDDGPRYLASIEHEHIGVTRHEEERSVFVFSRTA